MVEPETTVSRAGTRQDAPRMGMALTRSPSAKAIQRSSVYQFCMWLKNIRPRSRTSRE